MAFEDDELEDMVIKETREAASDNIIYMAMEDQKHAKKIYYWKADSRKDSIEVKNYILPQFFEQFKALNRLCAARQVEDKQLKMQLRFGEKDLEVYVKKKGTNGQFRKVELNEFVGKEVELPPFYAGIKWKMNSDRLSRKKLDYTERRGAPPSMRNRW